MRAGAIGLCLAICTRTVDELAQGRATGWGSGVYLGFNQAREPERHRSTLRGQPGIDSLCQVQPQPQSVGQLAHTNPEPAPSGSTIHHIRTREPERHRANSVLINHLTSTRSVRYTQTVHPPQPMLSRVLSRLSLNLAERAVLRYIRQNPGHQLFMINDATLKSHHSWGTKSVLSDLERHGKIYVRRFRPIRVKGDITIKKIKPLYYAADRYHA